MSLYQKEYTVRSCDVDMYRRLRLSALFTFFQEAAIAHTQQLGAGREKTLDKGLLWVVTQQTLRIERLPVYDETVTLLSWPGRTMHLFFPRFYEMRDPEGRTLLRGGSLWALIDAESRRMIFPEEHGISVEEEANAPEGLFPRRFKSVPLSPAASFRVPFSFADLNGHMNNTRYFDLVMDHLEESLRTRTPSEITAEYTGEARPGDEISLCCGTPQPGLFCLSARTDAPLFQVRFQYK